MLDNVRRLFHWDSCFCSYEYYDGYRVANPAGACVSSTQAATATSAVVASNSSRSQEIWTCALATKGSSCKGRLDQRFGLVSTICENHVDYLVLRCTLLLSSICVPIYPYIRLLWFMIHKCNNVYVHVICSKKWPKTELLTWKNDIPGQGQAEECSLVGWCTCCCLLVR